MIFRLEISEHGSPRQMGDTSTSERACIIGLLAQVAQHVGAGRPINTPVPIILADQQIGFFVAGPESHSAKG